MMDRLPTGSKILDYMLNGGYEKDVITTVYGPAGCGKTCLCMLCALTAARKGKKIIYIDTEGGFSLERLKQLGLDYKKILDKITFLRPTNFEEQKKTFEKLKQRINDKIGLIIVDTIAMLYRLKLGKDEDIYEINRELGKQVGLLAKIAREKQIPILITNQVYADLNNKNKVIMVGGDLLRYGSKCIIELQTTPQNNRKAILKKHRSIKEEKSMLFKIIDKGIIGTKESKGFKLF